MPHLMAMQGQNHYKQKTVFFWLWHKAPPKKTALHNIRRLFFFLVQNVNRRRAAKNIQQNHPLRRKPAVTRRFSQDVQWRYSRPRESQLAP